jgi:hypothetical protein
VIPAYITMIFFIFAISARRSVQQTCHYLNQSSCYSERTLNYVIIAIAVIFILYLIYWSRHSYQKDTTPFHIRDVELASSLTRHLTSTNNTNGGSGAHSNVMSSSNNDEYDDSLQSPPLPRSRTSLAHAHTTADFGIGVVDTPLTLTL